MWFLHALSSFSLCLFSSLVLIFATGMIAVPVWSDKRPREQSHPEVRHAKNPHCSSYLTPIYINTPPITTSFDCMATSSHGNHSYKGCMGWVPKPDGRKRLWEKWSMEMMCYRKHILTNCCLDTTSWHMVGKIHSLTTHKCQEKA